MPYNKRSACQIKILRLHQTQKCICFTCFSLPIYFCNFLSVRRFGITQGLLSLCSRFCFFAAILQTATALTKTRWFTKEPFAEEKWKYRKYRSVSFHQITETNTSKLNKKLSLYLPTVLWLSSAFEYCMKMTLSNVNAAAWPGKEQKNATQSLEAFSRLFRTSVFTGF